MTSSADITMVAGELEREGFHIFHDALNPQLVEKARQEIQDWLDIDLRERMESGSTTPWHTGTAGTSVLTSPTHLLLDAYAKSSALDQLVEHILTDPVASGVLRVLAGEKIKFRGYNIQRMTGDPDPKPTIGIAPNPHEWHRDSPGEFGIALFLEDVPGPNNGATSLVPGSQYFPYCPRWNCLFGPPYVTKYGTKGLNWFLRFNLANRLLGRKIAKKATAAYGKQGDFYFFINDVWHGREPNTNGRSGIKMMIGAFPADDAFPDKVVPPDEATLAKLPPHVREAAGQFASTDKPFDNDTILKRIRRYRRENAPPLIFKLAKFERDGADAISNAIMAPLYGLKTRIEPPLSRLKARVDHYRGVGRRTMGTSA
jgi:hypothetical protein